MCFVKATKLTGPFAELCRLSVRRLDAALALGQGFVISGPVVLNAVVVTGRRLRCVSVVPALASATIGVHRSSRRKPWPCRIAMGGDRAIYREAKRAVSFFPQACDADAVMMTRSA